MRQRIVFFLAVFAFFFIHTPGLWAEDLSDQTTKSASPPIEAPEKKISLFEIGTTVDRELFVSGEGVVLKVMVVFSRQLTPFWEDLKEIDFSPFKVEKMILGERKTFDRSKETIRDAREIIFFLSLPSSFAYGEYTIPSFVLRYSYFEGKEEKKRSGSSGRNIVLKKVPVLARVFLEKDAIVVGEINTIRLQISRENGFKILNHEIKTMEPGEDEDVGTSDIKRWIKSLEVHDKKITDLENPTLGAFKLLRSRFWTVKHSLVITEFYEYRFAFYDMGGSKVELPGFNIWYLDISSGEKKNLQEPKEIATAPLDVLVNSSIREGRENIEWIKDILPLSGIYGVYLSGYLPLGLGAVLIIFLIFCLVRGTRLKDSADVHVDPNEEPLDRVFERLKTFLSSAFDKLTIEILISVRKDVAKLLSRAAGISDEFGAAKTFSDFSALSFTNESAVFGGRASEFVEVIGILDRAISFSSNEGSVGVKIPESEWEKIRKIIKN